jgi:hypothetical protein
MRGEFLRLSLNFTAWIGDYGRPQMGGGISDTYNDTDTAYRRYSKIQLKRQQKISQMDVIDTLIRSFGKFVH